MRDNKGFTLIELLIVVVIIGILAAIAIPKFASTREKAYISSMKSDLRNINTQQEIYFADNYEYGANIAAINATLSEGVTGDIGGIDTEGWSATLSHDGTDVTCSFDSTAAGTNEIECTEPAA